MKPAIFGLGGERLSTDERFFLRDVRPIGIILFKRNISTPGQVARLVDEVRSAIGAETVLVMIDQEGGRVQRLGPPHWRRIPAARYFGELVEKDPGRGRKALQLSTLRMGAELRKLGINCDCAPVLDVPSSGAHDVIGDRAFGADPDLVADLGRVMMNALMASGILPVIKHIPGHGRGRADSHLELPTINATLDELRETDFVPFCALKDAPLAMTAHVLYSAIDPDAAATHSEEVIRKIIRGEIGFEGLLVSDDLAMNALSGSPADRAERSLSAGVDLVLHCNGNLDEMGAIADVLADMPETTGIKLHSYLAEAMAQPQIDVGDITRRYDELTTEKD